MVYGSKLEVLGSRVGNSREKCRGNMLSTMTKDCVLLLPLSIEPL